MREAIAKQIPLTFLWVWCPVCFSLLIMMAVRFLPWGDISLRDLLSLISTSGGGLKWKSKIKVICFFLIHRNIGNPSAIT